MGLIVDPGQAYQSVKGLGSRLTPQPGWNFRGGGAYSNYKR